MGIFQTDVIICEMLKQGLEDMRKDVWLLDDVFSSLLSTPIISEKYGAKEIANAKDWFLNNKIDVLMRYRTDKDTLPCITVSLGNSSEIEDMKSLGDLSHEVETIMPNTIGKPISYIVKPFTPSAYDSTTGILSVPKSVKLRGARAGQILVDPDTGNGYEIVEIVPQGIRIGVDQELSLTRAGIIPKFPFYRVRRERSFFQESITIGCHVHGDPASLLWLHAITSYLILRYREALLEARCFTQSSISSSDLVPNGSFEGPGGENAYSRYITLSGMVENSWLKSPRRVIEAVELTEETDLGLRTTIKICSNLDSPESLDTEDDPWTTVAQDDEE